MPGLGTILRAAAATALLVSLGPTGAADADRAPAARTAAPPVGVTRVLAISVDGLNPSAITRLGRSGAPNLYRLIDEGATTLNARTEREQTVTLPNHTGMMTGRRIDRSVGGHGVTWDDDRAGTTVQKAAGHATRSVFSGVHRAGGSTALFTTKTKFALYQRSWPGSIDRFVVRYAHSTLLPIVRQDLVDHARAFTFLHVSLPDRTGHESGFMSQAYVDAVKRTDYQLGTILKTIEDHPALRDHLVVVLTADHGGLGAGHSSPTALADYRVPFLVWGAGVAHSDLYDLNPDYRDPGTERTLYFGVQPVRNGDLANLASGLLGIAAVPGSTLDAKQDLDVLVP